MAGAREFARLHPALTPCGGQMVGHGLLRSLFHIGFGRRAAAGGCRVHAPVIQHLRDVQRLGCGVTALHFVDETQE